MNQATVHLLLANSITHSIGSIFQPIYKLFATILAWIYGVIPNYAIAIAILTILIMGALTPLTVKQTKSMFAMQRLQPEIKKLQAKYKGPENRQQLNEEMMRLYKEAGVNPAGGCLPLLIQMPFLFILYGIIRGLTNVSKTAINVPQACHLAFEKTHIAPRYIPQTSKMYCNLIASHGKMEAFGINLALKPFSSGLTWIERVPYLVLVAAAVALQFIQMSQMNKRNTNAQANSQMQTLQKFMPIIFAYIYFLIPAAVLIYMIVSTLMRIATQDVIFRTGLVEKPPAGAGGAKSAPAAETALPPENKPAAKSKKAGTEVEPAEQNGAKPKANPATRSKDKRKRKDR